MGAFGWVQCVSEQGNEWIKLCESACECVCVYGYVLAAARISATYWMLCVKLIIMPLWM